MVENVNASKNPSTGEFVDVKRYIGVASVNIVAVNPNNDKMRQYGWNIEEGAPEPQYTSVSEINGKQRKNARVRLLAQIQDFEDKPVIALDFWCHPEVMLTKDGTKAKVIDAYTRTAWGTKEELSAKRVPAKKDGTPSMIATPYKPCHHGEEALAGFIYKYLNITPLEIFDRTKNAYVPSINPGRLTIDNWSAICDGDVKEIAEYIAMQPNNCVKVVLGIRTNEDNRSYQTFLDSRFIANGAKPNPNTGEYDAARKAIDKYFAEHQNSSSSFKACPVKLWQETASKVDDNTEAMFENGAVYADDITAENPNDLPF